MEYQNPASTADIIIEREKEILLIKRKHEPFKDKWALPGGHLDYGLETLEHAASRELQEETGLITPENQLQLFGVYSAPNRDPRGHYITHVYIAKTIKGTIKPGDDAKDTRFFPLENLPELAFDHNKILKDYLIWRQNV